ncbi:GGDEF domain-containing protein [Psychromonas sp.]|nr:GGDEF domain-containing protein [Psychromonas sp.]
MKENTETQKIKMEVLNNQGESMEVDKGYRFGENFFNLLAFIKPTAEQDRKRNSPEQQCDIFYRDIMNYDFIDSHNQHMADGRFDLAAKNLNAIHSLSIDEMTGLRKKEYLQRKLASLENQMYLDEISNFSLVMCDLDKFKEVNDNFGHSIGDDTLALFGKLIRESIRPTDYAYRFGGEEFLILLPNSNLDEAVRVADRVRNTVADRLHLGHYGLNQVTAFDIEKSQIQPQESEEFDAFFLARDITCSFGVSNYSDCGQSTDSLFAQADDNLYVAKNNGRNRVAY